MTTDLRFLASVIRRDVDDLASEEHARAMRYLTLYARAAKGRRNHSPVGIYRSGSARRYHCCYVCGETWTTCSRYPETRASIERRTQHIRQHAAEHAREIALYILGRLTEIEIGFTARVDRVVAERTASLKRRVKEAEASAAQAIARANAIAHRLQHPNDPLPESAGDRFELLDLQ